MAVLWIHEVCRTVLDRFGDANRLEHLFDRVKSVAAGAFKIREKYLRQGVDEILFSYGCPEGKNTYRRVPESEQVMQ